MQAVRIDRGDLPTLFSSFSSWLAGLGKEQMPQPESQQPAVPIRSSVKPDYLICLKIGES